MVGVYLQAALHGCPLLLEHLSQIGQSQCSSTKTLGQSGLEITSEAANNKQIFRTALFDDRSGSWQASYVQCSRAC